MLKGPEQTGRSKGGVHHQGQMMLFGNAAYRLNIRHLKAGVANGFTVKHSGFFRDLLFVTIQVIFFESDFLRD